MGETVDRLLQLMLNQAGFDVPYEEIRDLQIKAINERFQEQRGRIKLLAMRADDAGIDEIQSMDDVVPLLLPHTAYKSYPESFLLDMKWNKLTNWLGSVSANPTDNTNLQNINGIDDWIERLQQAGHYVSCSSGTTGKSAVLNLSAKDVEFGQQDLVNAMCWAVGFEADQSWRMFPTAPVALVPKNIAMGLGLFGAFARTDVEPFVYPAPPVTVGLITDMVLMRKKITDGTALPEEISKFEHESAKRQKAMEDAIQKTAEALIDARTEKLLLVGFWSGHYAVAKAVRELGYSARDFTQKNVLLVSGGLKRAVLPDDYREFVYETFNIPAQQTFMSYGMQELQTIMPRCQKGGRYHIPAWLVCLPLDKSGEKLLPIGQQPVQGRAAFFDLSLEGRWGGIISGDRIDVDFSPCACGAKSPSIDDTIARYADLNGDDKIACSGTVDSYVRGIS